MTATIQVFNVFHPVEEITINSNSLFPVYEALEKIAIDYHTCIKASTLTIQIHMEDKS